MWQCKLCQKVVSTRTRLFRHYKLVHVSRPLYPCIYLDCPCTFKTFKTLYSHTSRVHPHKKHITVATFSCHLCTFSGLAAEKEYFSHINTHLKSSETVHCMFKGCSYQTNIYGTFKSHKTRKHTPYTLEDFKPGIVNTIESQTSACVAERKMEKTFPHRRQEIVRDMPFIADFKSRWPALFSVKIITSKTFLKKKIINVIPV
ncbi:hypothetical protein NQD34_008320 [Periophthalmus magnuspinnatus]|nr:hypothetical protein NQD34_008320 [Periophthalmus magnuspinnatus]